MVTIAEEPEKVVEPSPRERQVRTIIAGHPQGAVRRIALYIIASTGIVGAIALDGYVGLTLGSLALVCLLLLGFSDDLA